MVSVSLRKPTVYNVEPASPAMERPGSISSSSILRSFSFRNLSQLHASSAAMSPRGTGLSSSVYLIPNPPPYQAGGTDTGGLCISFVKSSIMLSASLNAVVSVICEPMWLWNPLNATWLLPSMHFIILRISSFLLMEIPNFESEPDVMIYSWV